MKLCRACGRSREESTCRVCRLAGKARYRESRREALAAKQRDYHQRTKPARLAQMRRYHIENRDANLARMRVWVAANLDRKRAERLARLRARPGARLQHNVSARIRQMLRGKKWARSREIIGYDGETLKLHIERQLHSGMTWENYGAVWHIDHILPKHCFRLPDEIAAFWALTNIRPLPTPENLKKGARREHLL